MPNAMTNRNRGRIKCEMDVRLTKIKFQIKNISFTINYDILFWAHSSRLPFFKKKVLDNFHKYFKKPLRILKTWNDS